ncbi:MAG: aminoglycoside 6-adenylyltransferase [Candidatus Muiribacteriota bacterium]
MRSADKIYELLLTFARNNTEILAVYMNGSRSNPDVKPDKYQDFDIVFVVKKTESFVENNEWINYFGEIAMIQEPDSELFNFPEKVDYSKSYAWLILFKDGNRIDLTIQTVDIMKENFLKDSLCVILLDKEGILPDISKSDDRIYWIKKPAENQYLGCCNEFWWCINNVAKGIARKQLPYALRMYYTTVHAELNKMLEWYIGINTDFKVSAGYLGKYFQKYLSAEFYEKYCKTYSDGNLENLKKSINEACSLFRFTAIEVGKILNYHYNFDDEDNITTYFKKITGE